MKFVAEYTNYSKIEIEANTIQEAIDKAVIKQQSEITSNSEGWGFNTLKEQK